MVSHLDRALANVRLLRTLHTLCVFVARVRLAAGAVSLWHALVYCETSTKSASSMGCAGGSAASACFGSIGMVRRAARGVPCPDVEVGVEAETCSVRGCFF